MMTEIWITRCPSTRDTRQLEQRKVSAPEKHAAVEQLLVQAHHKNRHPLREEVMNQPEGRKKV
jgi:hypothetical protein